MLSKNQKLKIKKEKQKGKIESRKKTNPLHYLEANNNKLD